MNWIAAKHQAAMTGGHGGTAPTGNVCSNAGDRRGRPLCRPGFSISHCKVPEKRLCDPARFARFLDPWFVCTSLPCV